jgi:hypothetical protein
MSHTCIVHSAILSLPFLLHSLCGKGLVLEYETWKSGLNENNEANGYLGTCIVSVILLF